MSNIYESPQASGNARRQRDDTLVTEKMIRNIGRGRFWARFLSVLSYIFVAFMVIAFIGILIFLFAVSSEEFAQQVGGPLADLSSSVITIGAIAYLVFLVVFGYISFLNAKAYGRYARYSAELSASQDQEDVVECFNAFTALMKYITITIIISIAAGVLITTATAYFMNSGSL